MNVKHLGAAVVALACVSAAEAPKNYSVYGGPAVDSDPVILNVFDHALARCNVEASVPPRGTTFTNSYYHNAALRACLSRHGFIDNGAYAYPANSLF
jgi:hypothetical protein